MKKKRYGEEQIVRILQAAEQGEKTVTELCKAHGVSEQSCYRWRRKYGDMNVADVRRLRELEKENSQLKRLLAEGALEIAAMKAVLSKKW